MNPAARRLRVVAWNLHGLRDTETVIEVLEELTPDLVLVSESGRRGRLRAVAERLGMEPHLDAPAPFRRRVQDAILVRPPLSLRGARLVRFAGSARWHPRGAMVGELHGVAATAVAVAATHLGLRQGERLRHARSLAEELRAPFILGGDLNEGREGPAARLLAGLGTDAWDACGTGPGATFPSTSPVSAIDRVVVSREFRVIGAMVAEGGPVQRASDHLPLVADVEFGESVPTRGGD